MKKDKDLQHENFEMAVEELSELLLEKEVRLVTAESCTGGMIAASMTERPGSSAVFERGFVSYSNQSKMELLSVSSNVLNHYGAVSEQCAESMVLGALKHSQAEVAVAVTGIAGPGGGTDEKPVGLVYIATCIKGQEPQISECHFFGSREEIRRATCDNAFSLLLDVVGRV